MTRQHLLYKVGRCYDLLGQEDKALSKYREVLYSHRAENEFENRKTDPAWVVKSAQAGITMCLKRNTPESIDNASEFLRALRDLQLLPAEDYEKQIRELKEKQKLL